MCLWDDVLTCYYILVSKSVFISWRLCMLFFFLISLSMSVHFQLVPSFYNCKNSALKSDGARGSFVKRSREMWQLLPSLEWSCRTQRISDCACFLDVFIPCSVQFPAKLRLKPWPTRVRPWVPGDTAGSRIGCNLCLGTHERENRTDWHLGNESPPV